MFKKKGCNKTKLNNRPNTLKTSLQLILVFSFFFAIFASQTNAQDEGILGSVLTIFNGDDIVQLYGQYSTIIDVILLFILFYGLTQFAFQERFGAQAKLISAALSAMLSIGAVIFVRQMYEQIMVSTAYGYFASVLSFGIIPAPQPTLLGGPGIMHLFGPVSLMLFGIVLAFLLYRLISALTGADQIISVAVAYFVTFSICMGFFHKLLLVFPGLSILVALMKLAWFGCFIIIIVYIIRFILNLRNGNASFPWSNFGSSYRNTSPFSSSPGTPGGMPPSGRTPTSGTLPPRPPGRIPPPTTGIAGTVNPHDPPTPPSGPPPGEKKRVFEPRVPRVPKTAPIPDKEEIIVDLSPYFNRMRSQDSLGACVAFAASSMFEYILHFGGRPLPANELSPLYLYYKTRAAHGEAQTDGGLVATDALIMLKNNGVCFEKLWEFEDKRSGKWAQTPPANADADAIQKKIISFFSLDKNSPDDWAREILGKNPIMIGVNVPHAWQGGYNQKFYAEFGMPAVGKGGHAMVIVGYHSHYPYNGTGVKAFKIRNNWGNRWGELGYTWVPAETLMKLLRRDPIVIKGWKKEVLKKFRIKGRVIFDEKFITPQQTGKQLYEFSELVSPCKTHPVIVGVMAQINGHLSTIAEITITNKSGRFDIQFEYDAALFEPLTLLPQHYPILQGINFKNLPPGVVVYKRHPDEKERYFHIANMNLSRAGRGGEGAQYPENPFSATLHHIQGVNCSGIPITFNQEHTEENNVIIPVFSAPGQLSQASHQDNKTQIQNRQITKLKEHEEYEKKLDDLYSQLKKITISEEKKLITERNKLVKIIYDIHSEKNNFHVKKSSTEIVSQIRSAKQLSAITFKLIKQTDSLVQQILSIPEEKSGKFKELVHRAKEWNLKSAHLSVKIGKQLGGIEAELVKLQKLHSKLDATNDEKQKAEIDKQTRLLIKQSTSNIAALVAELNYFIREAKILIGVEKEFQQAGQLGQITPAAHGNQGTIRQHPKKLH
ncbi:MAG: C1 family peptidase [Nanoarchaeota archaeon]|nr:C1 family peptidase [Nanoarchaeota archaeon]